MSDWGKRKSRETNSYPLRKIVGYVPDEKYAHLTYELLECSHTQLPRSDMFGETNAVRRRCRKCAVSEEI